MQTSLNSKSILARTLATENIKVEHLPNAQTAMFDVVNRVLVLPVWEQMSDSLYDMFVGHEVGHALFTPCREEDLQHDNPWITDAERIGGNVHAPYVMGLFNIIEDVRIERKIKEKFPGLRRDFVAGYRELLDRNFFGTKGVDLSTLSLGDRINIHFKGGTEMNVPFSDEEMKFVDAISKVETFDEMIRVGEDLYNYILGLHQNQNKKKMVNVTANPHKFGNGSDSSSGSVDVLTKENTDNNQGKSPSNGNGEQQNKNAEIQNGMNGSSAGKGLAPDVLPEMKTQNTFDQNKNKMVKRGVNTTNVTTLPVPIIENIVLPFKRTNEVISNHYREYARQYRSSIEVLSRMDSAYKNFVSNCKPLVSTLVKQFEMKKAADMQKRTSVSRTGKIDTDRIFKYKVSEDIFLRCATVAEGKNHGMVMFIDWSGSMSPCTEDVLNQVMILSLFCRRMNIPFDVYLFSSQFTVLDYVMPYAQRNQQSSSPEIVKTVSNFGGKVTKGESTRNLGSFALIHILSSDMKTAEFNEAHKNLFTLGKMISGDSTVLGTHGNRSVPPSFGQGNTPLDSTILAAMKIVPEFQKKHKVQIVNTIFLTDGEAGDSFFSTYDYNQHNIVNCPLNKKQYNTTGHLCATDLMLSIFSDVTGSNTIGFFITSSRYCRYTEGSEWLKKVREDGFFEVQKTRSVPYWSPENKEEKKTMIAHGYDRLFILPNKNEITETNQELESLSSDASFVKIRNAFSKGVEKRAASRSFLNRFADVIAVEKR